MLSRAAVLLLVSLLGCSLFQSKPPPPSFEQLYLGDIPIVVANDTKVQICGFNVWVPTPPGVDPAEAWRYLYLPLETLGTRVPERHMKILPPGASVTMHLRAGRYKLSAESCPAGIRSELSVDFEIAGPSYISLGGTAAGALAGQTRIPIKMHTNYGGGGGDPEPATACKPVGAKAYDANECCSKTLSPGTVRQPEPHCDS